MRQRLNNRALSHRLVQIRHEASGKRVAALCEEMLRECGGIEGFLRRWHSCLCLDLRHGGYRAFRHFDAVMRLMQVCDRTPPDYGRMSDKELADAIANIVGFAKTVTATG